MRPPRTRSTQPGSVTPGQITWTQATSIAGFGAEPKEPTYLSMKIPSVSKYCRILREDKIHYYICYFNYDRVTTRCTRLMSGAFTTGRSLEEPSLKIALARDPLSRLLSRGTSRGWYPLEIALPRGPLSRTLSRGTLSLDHSLEGPSFEIALSREEPWPVPYQDRSAKGPSLSIALSRDLLSRSLSRGTSRG